MKRAETTKMQKLTLVKKAAAYASKHDGNLTAVLFDELHDEGLRMVYSSVGYQAYDESREFDYQVVKRGNLWVTYPRNEWLEYQAAMSLIKSGDIGKAEASASKVSSKSLVRDLKEAFAAAKPKGKTKTTKTEKKESKPKAAKPKIDVIDRDKQFEAIKKLRLKGVKFEMLGTWIWATGDTKPNKDELKRHGFHFSAKKQAWYWKPTDDMPRRRAQFKTMDGVRTYWGNQNAA